MKFINKKHNLLSILLLIFTLAIVNLAVADTNALNIQNKTATSEFNFDSIYTPVSSNRIMSTVTSHYQAFTIPGSTTFSYFLWNFYSNTNCTGLIDSVQIGFQGAPETLGPNTYTAYAAASQKICAKLSGSCATELTTTNSIQVSYVYSSGSSTLGQCYNNSGAGDKLAAVGSTTCTSISCLLTGSYNPDALTLWTQVGNADVSSAASNETRLAINESGTPYVAYSDIDNTGIATVKRFNGTTWEAVGINGGTVSSVGATNLSLAINKSGVPYLAYKDPTLSYKATVKALNINTNSWDTVGNAAISSGSVRDISLAINESGTPYLAYIEDTGNFDTKLMKFNINTNVWDSLGNTGQRSGNVVSLAIDKNGIPYVASDIPITVRKYTGVWENLGSPISSIATRTISLAINDIGIPYIAYQNSSNSYKTYVKRYIGNVDWESVGINGGVVSSGSSDYTTLAINNSGTPYVVYQDGSNGPATVMKFNGTAWVNVGSSEFSGTQANYTSLAITESGIPYVAYQEGIVGPAVTVKFNGN